MSRFRMVPPLWFAVALAGEFALDRWAPVAQLVPGGWRWFAVPVALAAVAVGAPGARALVRQRTTLHPFGEPTALVTDGPYRFTRNPLYLALALLLTAGAIGFGTLAPFLVVPAFMAVITVRFIRREEAALEAAFGAGFRDYRRRVRRWI